MTKCLAFIFALIAQVVCLQSIIVDVIDGIHILLFEKTKTRVIASIVDFYNHKKFYNIAL